MDNTQDKKANEADYEPKLVDVIVVKAMLTSALKLPPELIDYIVDRAEYWPHTTVETLEPTAVQGSSGELENQFLLRSKPLGFVNKPHESEDAPWSYTAIPPDHLNQEHPIEAFQQEINTPVPMVRHPCRKIVFTIESHDQGWASNRELQHGPYHASWTWFEAGLERFEATTATGEANLFSVDKLRPLAPLVQTNQGNGRLKFEHPLAGSEDKLIQRNITAKRDTTKHQVVWSYTDSVEPKSDEEAELIHNGRGVTTGDGNFVRSLKLGDVVTVWAMARFPGWMNYVEKVKMDIYWVY